MPVTLRCEVCNFQLFSEWDQIVSPIDVAKRFNYRCPKCKNKLNYEKPSLIIKVAKKQNLTSSLSLRYKYYRSERKRSLIRRV